MQHTSDSFDAASRPHLQREHPCSPSPVSHDATSGDSPAVKVLKGMGPQPFLRQRRLPSILLDSWEFRKLAPEGSVLANAMVSYDVDDDGVEEVIVGTTEGLLCVVKPDCRAPLFPRVLAATISVVLYTPIQKRLVLVTLEGQCEVIDYFLCPAHQLPQHGRTRTPSCGADGGALTHQSTESTTSSSRSPHNININSSSSGGGAAVSASLSPGAGNPLSAPPNSTLWSNRSHTSTRHPLLYETAVQSTTSPTHVFHVPSNCLCADLSTDAEASLIFLGSYDRRFYVYAIATGSCLLSLFVHDPITSVKAFAVPAAAAHGRKTPTSSSSISIYDCTGKHGGRSRTGANRARERRRNSAEVSTHTVEYRSPGPSSQLYVPLVFVATPTHLILLPAGLNELQQWRKLQPKTAHLPLTVQLHGDTPSEQLGQSSTPGGSRGLPASTPSKAPAALRQNLLSSGEDASHRPRNGATAVAAGADGGAGGRGVTAPMTMNSEAEPSYTCGDGGAGAAAAAATPNNGGGRRPPRGLSGPPACEGETPLPLASSSSSLSRSSGTQRGGDAVALPPRSFSAAPSPGAGAAAAGGKHSSNSSSRRGLAGNAEGAVTADGNAVQGSNNTASAAASSAKESRGDGALNAEANAPLSASQQRRLARKRAIQAAEMGRPVLVKPLWALHLGQHTLDVVPLQSSPFPFQRVEDVPLTAAAAATVKVSRASAEAASTSGTERTAVSTVAVNNLHEYRTSLSPASAHHPHHHRRRHSSSSNSRQRHDLARANSTSPFSLDSSSSASDLRDSSDVVEARSSVTQHGGAQHDRLRRRVAHSSRDGGEATDAATVSNIVQGSASVAGWTPDRSGSGRAPTHTSRRRRPPHLQAVQADSGSASDASNDSDDGSSDAGSTSSGVRFRLPGAAEDGGSRREDGEFQEGAVESEHDPSSSSSASYSSTDEDTSNEGDSSNDADEGSSSRNSHSSSSDSSDSEGAAAVDPSLLAKSLARMRVESVPAMLLRRVTAASSTTTTKATKARGAEATSIAPTPHTDKDGVGCITAATALSGGHTSLMDLANVDVRRGHHHARRHRRRHSCSAKPTETSTQFDDAHAADVDASAVGGDGCDVRLPTSVDVAVGASQVAVALSCEDGLAIELRFAVEKFSSLHRRARHRTDGVLCLFDLRHPVCPRQLLGRRRSKHRDRVQHDGGGSGGVGDGAVGRRGRPPYPPPPHPQQQQQQQQQQRSTQPASSPSSPMTVRSFPRMEKPAHRRKANHRGSCPPTSIIYLPLPTPGSAVSRSTSSSPQQQQQQQLSVSSTSRVHSNGAPAGGLDAFGVGASGNKAVMRTCATRNAQASSSSSASAVKGCGRKQDKAASQPQQPPKQLQHRGGDDRDTSIGDSPRSRRREKDEGVVLRARCLWAARLGDSPLVQRARVFSVKDNHHDNAFCTVFVAANGTCYAIDGDTLSVVECSVKEDCSSFTVMAGPYTTMPLPRVDASAFETSPSPGGGGEDADA
ncbi:hypothetical protein ABB37_08631, partial [Leptomonas pyrrhocoris]